MTKRRGTRPTSLASRTILEQERMLDARMKKKRISKTVFDLEEEVEESAGEEARPA